MPALPGPRRRPVRLPETGHADSPTLAAAPERPEGRATDPREEELDLNRRLHHRRILITGAAGGIGRASAERCLREGAAVALADIDRDRLARTARSLAAMGPVFETCFDVTDAASIRDGVARATGALGGLDGLVNNAGWIAQHRLEELDWSDWDRVHATNLKGPMQVCQAALPALRAADGAAIVNVASGAGLRPIPQSLAYTTAKAGLVMASRALAEELAPDRIRVNTVCPGPVETDMMRSTLDETGSTEALRSRNALRRIGAPAEIAPAVAFLLSAEASFITGSTLAVEGGRVLH